MICIHSILIRLKEFLLTYIVDFYIFLGSFDALKKDRQEMKMRNIHLKAYEGMKTEEE